MSHFNRFAIAAIPAVLMAASSLSYAADAWKEGVTYNAGSVVTYAGSDYRALVTHVSYVGANWNPASTTTLWTRIGAASTTLAPTAKPTLAPTIKPTSTPVIVPSTTPTVKPTLVPTSSPTVKPTPAPTTFPTAKPSATATTGPTVKPTSSPIGVCSEVTQWETTKSYSTGALVVYNGNKYSAKWWTQGNTPSQTDSASPWKYEGACPAPTATPVGMMPEPTPKPAATLAPGEEVTPPQQPQVGAYFTQWGVYERDYEVADIVSSGAAANLTFINYAFGNIYQKNGGYECAMVNKLETAAKNPNSPEAGTGGDSYSDYGRKTNRRVDPTDQVNWDDNLSGNFREFKAYKKKFPDTKLFISLGGWTWSKWFSAASKTDALRKQMVKSCIDIYIKGDLPLAESRGGPGAAANIFDGIDIDWEFPGVQGIGYNMIAPEDKQNFTLLLAEFRKQLDELAVQNRKKYYLTVAIGAGRDKIEMTSPRDYSRYLDWINVMTYDYNGGWSAEGPTDFQSHLYADPNSPQYKCPGKPTDKCYGDRSLVSYYNTDDAINLLINSGVNPKKLVLGIPYYGRGWTGVSNFSNGLYQKATRAADGIYEPGNEDFKILKDRPGNVFIHPITKASYKFDGSTFWSYDTPEAIQIKIDYAKAKGLNGGVFGWALDGDDKSATLSKAMGNARK
ncbi:chitinase [Deefgea tanakiae]|uniref:chitinase n=1 Tax=Deefgea tanakiae TaxID=2865840 RepID=A0ABX8Z1M6_9NEIS|nr:glycosyl hydrolase family 18 protein [Deefgea tanakiae]QZA76466.1 chitinase [Deefgea tanakiae]